MKHTILIVEDHPMNLELLRRRLEKNGYNVVEQPDGSHLPVLLQQFRPDLILMDMNLPEIDGWTLTSRLKADPKTRSIPVIAVTADAMPGDREKALKAGCDEYVTKPVDFKQLLSLIEKFLKGFRPQDLSPSV